MYVCDLPVYLFIEKRYSRKRLSQDHATDDAEVINTESTKPCPPSEPLTQPKTEPEEQESM